MCTKTPSATSFGMSQRRSSAAASLRCARFRCSMRLSAGGICTLGGAAAARCNRCSRDGRRPTGQEWLGRRDRASSRRARTRSTSMSRDRGTRRVPAFASNDSLARADRDWRCVHRRSPLGHVLLVGDLPKRDPHLRLRAPLRRDAQSRALRFPTRSYERLCGRPSRARLDLRPLDERPELLARQRRHPVVTRRPRRRAREPPSTTTRRSAQSSAPRPSRTRAMFSEIRARTASRRAASSPWS